jgi:uncharacterized membrane protein
MTREKVVRLLFVQWLFVAIIAILIVTMQSVSGKYGNDSEQAWNWLLGQFTPALSILTSAAFSDPNTRWKNSIASAWKWKTAFTFGFFQAFCLFLLLFVEPMLTITVYDLFARTQWALSLLQGVSVAAIGAVVFDGR